MPIPHHRRFPLIRNPHRSNVFPRHIRLSQRSRNTQSHIIPNLHRIMLHPPLVRKNLLVLILAHPHHRKIRIKNDTPSRRCALVNSSNKHVSPILTHINPTPGIRHPNHHIVGPSIGRLLLRGQ